MIKEKHMPRHQLKVHWHRQAICQVKSAYLTESQQDVKGMVGLGTQRQQYDYELIAISRKGGSYFLFLSTFAWATLRYLEILDENHMKRLQLLHIQNHESGSLVSHATINYTYLKIVDCCNGVLTSKFSFSKLQLLQLLRNHSSRTRASPAHLIPIDGSWQVCNKNCAAVLGFTIKQVLNYIHRQ